MKQSLLTATAALLSTQTLALVDYPAKPKDLSTPVQQRLAVKAPTAVSIGWNTYQKNDAPCVFYGTDKDVKQKVCAPAARTYPTSRTWFSTVVLSELKPATTYYYKIESTNSSVQEFFSPRSPGDRTPFAVNNVIDLGVYGADGFTTAGNPSKRDMIPTIDPSLNHTTIGRLFSTMDKYEMIIHPGDFAYADDWYLKPKNALDGKDAYEAIIEQFYDQLAPVMGRKPYMASPGNHEADCQEIPHTAALCPAGQKNFTDFMTRFGNNMPLTFPSSSSDQKAKVAANNAAFLANPPFWFSYEYGMVHVAMIDTETDFADAPDGPGGSAGLDGGPFGRANQQLEFLDTDLASVDRTITPWVVVAGHRPWYTTGSGCKPCQKAFEEILYKHGVDVAVFGHVHNGQRIDPIYKNTTDPAGYQDPKAPLYLVSGGAGNIEGLSSAKNAPPYVAFAYDTDFTYSTMTFQDPNNLKVEFIRSSTGDVLDTATLYKSHKDQFVNQS